MRRATLERWKNCLIVKVYTFVNGDAGAFRHLVRSRLDVVYICEKHG